MKKAAPGKTARDVMQTAVVTVATHDPLHVVQRLFTQEGIHGAPVVDDEDRVLGVITSTDILRAATEARDVAPTEPAVFREDLDFSRFVWSLAPDDLKERLQDSTVADAMTEDVVQVPPAAPISAVARALRENQVHRVFVTEDGRLCGVISAFDLVALLEED